jgi:uncharacterized membrane protein YeiB
VEEDWTMLHPKRLQAFTILAALFGDGKDAMPMVLVSASCSFADTYRLPVRRTTHMTLTGMAHFCLVCRLYVSS